MFTANCKINDKNETFTISLAVVQLYSMVKLFVFAVSCRRCFSISVIYLRIRRKEDKIRAEVEFAVNAMFLKKSLLYFCTVEPGTKGCKLMWVYFVFFVTYIYLKFNLLFVPTNAFSFVQLKRLLRLWLLMGSSWRYNLSLSFLCSDA